MLSAFLDEHPLKTIITHMPDCLFPSMTERAAWEGVSAEDRADLLRLYQQLRGVDYPMCTASQFMAFVRSGSRKAYEEPYFLRRRKLIAAMLHCCLTGTAEALDDVIDGVWCICEESSWVISAHNINPIPGAPKPQDRPLPEAEDCYIDLFAAQTAMILAFVSRMLAQALDDAAPVLRRRISREIERRIFTPFMLRDDFWWMGFLRKDLCNWTPWIVSSILYAASLEMQEPLLFSQLADRALRMVDRWLDVLPQDGGCDEGTAYYNMAGGALLDCLELMESATDGAMTFWQNEKIRSILSFPLKTQLENGWFVNFADCDAKPFLCGERLQTAGEKLNEPALIALGMQHRGTPSDQIADVPHLTRLLARLFHPKAEACAQAAPRDVWLPDLQLRVCERDGMILCCKGGHNGESHNHNDVGSFMLYVDGEPQLVDAGNMTYTAATFSDARYTLFNTRSAFHNVPLIGGCEQQPGEAFRAQKVQRLNDGLSLDIARAYGDEAGVEACRRTLRLTENGLVLQDEILLQPKNAAAWVFMLRCRPQVGQNHLISGAVRLCFDSDLSVQTEEIAISDPRMARHFPGSLWRVMLSAPAGTHHLRTFLFERMALHE